MNSSTCSSGRAKSFGWVALATALAVLALAPGCGGDKGHQGLGGGGSAATSGSSGGSGGSGGQGGATSASSSSDASSSASSSGAGAGGGGGGGGAPSCNPVTGSSDYPAEHEPNNSATLANPLASGKKGFTGSLCPYGDLDLFSIDVVDGGSLRASLSDGMGGCSAPHKVEMRILDGTLQPIVTAATAQNGCPALDPKVQTAVASLAAGTYYVELHNVGIAEVDYVLDMAASAPSCGDGIVQVQLHEQCDDGNSAPGDGCSDMCRLEAGNYLDETENNDTQATANSVDGFAGAVGSISPASDVDFFSFTVTVPGSSVRAGISDGLGGCPPGAPTVLHLFNPAGTQLVQVNGGGPGGCPLLTPAQHAAAANLPVGTYAIEVTTQGGNLQSSYVVDIHVGPPGCGDSLLETGEQCDDGNTTGGDGCSATCQLEKNYLTETEVNDTLGTANPLGSAAGFVAAIGTAGDIDYFSFVVTSPDTSALIHVDDGLGGCPMGFNPRVHLYDPSGTQIALDNGSGPGNCSAITPTLYPAAGSLQPGTYTVRVEDVSATQTTQVYVVDIQLVPSCGDGARTGAEQCDDGNTTSGDGCSATCQLEKNYLDETEVNDTIALANPLGSAAGFIGAIGVPGDHDFFSFDVTTAGSSVTAAVNNGLGACPPGVASRLRLFDPAGTQIALDSNSGPVSCSLINSTLYPAAGNLAVGTYTLEVQLINMTVTAPFYVLDITVQ